MYLQGCIHKREDMAEKKSVFTQYVYMHTRFLVMDPGFRKKEIQLRKLSEDDYVCF